MERVGFYPWSFLAPPLIALLAQVRDCQSSFCERGGAFFCALKTVNKILQDARARQQLLLSAVKFDGSFSPRFGKGC